MGSTRRTVLTAKHKAVLGFLGLLILWEVLQSNAVLEAFLTFGFAGVIPGTNIVLSPDAVILVTGVALGLVFIAVVLRILLKRPKNRVPANPERVAEAMATEQAELVPVVAGDIAPVVARPAAPGVFMRIWGRLRAAALPLEQNILHYSGVALDWIDAKMPIVARALHNAAHIVWALGLIIFVFARKWTLVGASITKKYMAIFWRWLVPYLWKFDTWLELQVRAFTKWARFKSRQYHSLTIIISMFRQYKKLYSESPIAAFFKSSPKRQVPRQEDEV